tara:strand:- start:1146 stop:2804 length:1659 start_codon:yes stop_codon:yes gene_type:complete
MIGSGASASGFKKSQKQIYKEGLIPAPTKGVDGRNPLSAMSTSNCIYAYNLVPEEYGLDLRFGYREHQINAVSSNGLGFKTIMVYEGLSPSDTKLFGVTNEGIWDITVEGGTPVLKRAFSTDTSADAGHGVYTNYLTDAGDQIMFYADSKNGLFTYTKATNSWTVTTGINNVTEANVDYVVVHKQRIWLIERDSSKAYYLPVGAKAGDATAFFFGSKFSHGGRLIGLINWSVDGGMGVDDYLVAVSSGGDVIPYQGADPAASSNTYGVSWESRGTYYVGRIPAGRRFFSEYSGELYILSSFGLIGMSDLLNGVDMQASGSNSLSYPIAKVLRTQLLLTGENLGWEPVFLPGVGKLLITSPINTETAEYTQYSMSLTVEGWGYWRGVPIAVAVEFKNKVYFGTVDNKVYVMDVYRDNVLIDTSDENALGEPIEFSVLTSYSDGGSPGTNKRLQYVRPNFLAVNPPAYQTKVFYDYQIVEDNFPFPIAPVTTASVWDTSKWDVGTWGTGGVVTEDRLQGASGMGRAVAVALRGEASAESQLVAFEVTWTSGGFT